MTFQIPLEVLRILDQLQKNDFEAYIVGGCVRDLFLKRKPNDWDITTNALPSQLQNIFPQSVYENQFGTVAVKTENEDPTLKLVEVTTFRKEGRYSDKRHPDEIQFAQTLKDDLSRRDFTINAIAMKIQKSKSKKQNENSKFEIIDPYNGQVDLKNRIIRAVGNPQERFQEDALRLMRAVRLACELNFKIEEQTLRAIKTNSSLLRLIAKERIRDEFIRIINTSSAASGILLLEETGLLKEFLPELREGIGVTQNKHHLYTVWEHLWRSLDYAARKNYNLAIRLASLFHDIGKPRTKKGEGEEATFYGHEALSAKMTAQILHRLRFPKDLREKIVKLVYYHYFVYDPEITTDSSVRRLIMRVGQENIFDLAKVREADRIGSGCPKAVPFRLRHFLFRVEKILQEMEGQQPSLKMLKINGNDIMRILGISPGPKIGAILNILLDEVLDNPQKNKKEYLEQKVEELGEHSLEQLMKLSQKAKENYFSLLKQEEEKIKKKYKV